MKVSYNPKNDRVNAQDKINRIQFIINQKKTQIKDLDQKINFLRPSIENQERQIKTDKINLSKYYKELNFCKTELNKKTSIINNLKSNLNGAQQQVVIKIIFFF
jgi:chromosome segregation ATPase